MLHFNFIALHKLSLDLKHMLKNPYSLFLKDALKHKHTFCTNTCMSHLPDAKEYLKCQLITSEILPVYPFYSTRFFVLFLPPNNHIVLINNHIETLLYESVLDLNTDLNCSNKIMG